MSIIVNEEDFLKIQNDKIKETYNNRVVHHKKEIRVEARVEKLEIKMDDVTSEIKMLNRTMRDVADTLREIKEDQKKIQAFEIEKSHLERDIRELAVKVTDADKLLFSKIDKLTEAVQKIKEQDAGNNIKINNNERVFWLIITGAIGALGWFNK
jgi:predicted RNase H-like nuclease (RuvC/YqgF family)